MNETDAQHARDLLNQEPVVFTCDLWRKVRFAQVPRTLRPSGYWAVLSYEHRNMLAANVPWIAIPTIVGFYWTAASQSG